MGEGWSGQGLGALTWSHAGPSPRLTPQTLCPNPTGLPSINVTTTPQSPPALEHPSPWLPRWAEEKPLRVLRPDMSA